MRVITCASTEKPKFTHKQVPVGELQFFRLQVEQGEPGGGGGGLENLR